MTALEEFTHELHRPDPLPERLALIIASIAYPDLEMGHYLQEIDQLALHVEERLNLLGDSSNRANRFLTIFCHELNFTGNRENYYHPDNSYLNIVLETRQGLPIMLCLLCVALARRLKLPIDGIGLPGHFMACYRAEQGNWLLDPFNGEVIAPQEAEAYLGRIFGVQPTLSEESFRPVTPEAWAQRILFNLRNIYLGQRNTVLATRVLDFLLVLMPRHPALWRERGLLHHQNEQWEAAILDLRRSFFLFGQHALVWNDDKDRNELIAKLGAEERRIVELYQQLIQRMGRMN